MKVRIKKTIAFLLLFNLLFLEIGLMPISNAGSSEVTTVAELQEAVKKATESKTIILANDFIFGEMKLEIPNFNVTIDGNNVVWNTGSTTVNGNEKGSLTFKNFKYDGSNIDKKIILLENTDGTVRFENTEFYNSSKGVMEVNTGSSASIELLKTHYYNNTAPAIQLGENANVEIFNSTIENNTGTGGGEATGAIAGRNYKGKLDINNSVFRNNVNKTVNTGTLGGGGGAIALHYFYGKVNIKDSIFDGNQTNGSGVDVKSTYDGGAIYILDGRDGATFDITGSTFMNNIAYDDGGAIMFQGTGNPGLTTTITNSTFYNNKAYGLDGANYSGGAIQFFKNGGSAKMTNTILSSTFVGNEAGGNGSSTEQRGGAIGLSGAGMFAMAAVTRNDSLFIGNSVYDANGEINKNSNYKDLSNYTTTQAGKANVINVDKGANPAYSNKDVLGVVKPKLTINDSPVVAGFKDEPVKTIPIRPEGIADNGYDGKVELLENDQRGFERFKDHGAVEMSWIKYDANGGTFGIGEMNSYDGNVYYEKDAEDKITQYYTVGKLDDKTTVIDGNKALNIEKKASEEDRKTVFLGWSTDKDATEPDKEYDVGKSIKYVDENITLYAVWGEIFRVTYVGNRHTDGIVPSDVSRYFDGNIVVVLEGIPEKDNHTFTGWNTEVNGNGETYQAKDEFIIKEATTLYAQWSENEKYKIIYDDNGSTSGEAPIDSKSPYYVNSEVTVLDEGTLLKDNYIFGGWNTKADESGETYQAKDEFIIKEDTTLYAVWNFPNIADIYRVTYDGNGHTGGIVPNDVSRYFNGNTVVVYEGEPEKENYIFGGWNTESDGSGTTYKTGDTFTITEDTTLYAHWTEIDIPEDKITVSFETNGGTEIPLQIVEENLAIRPDNPIRAGYRFMGWFKDESLMEEFDFNTPVTEDLILYAKWERDDIVVPIEPDIEEPEIQEPSEPVEPDPIEPEVIVPKPELNKSDHIAYMIGDPSGYFRPNDNISRAEAVTIFFRMLEDESRDKYWSTDNSFKDVKKSSWYNNILSTMENAKIIEPDRNGNFRPEEKMKRAEFAILLTKFFDEKGEKSHNFTDINGHWAEKEIAIVASKGWIEGYLDKTFRPDESITRAEVVKLVNRILDRTPDINNLLPNMIEFKDNIDKTRWYYLEIQEATNSHEYERVDNKSLENWTKLLPLKDWTELEK